MIVLKTSREIGLMRQAGRVSARALKLAGEAVEPGVSTAEIDRIKQAEAKPHKNQARNPTELQKTSDKE